MEYTLEYNKRKIEEWEDGTKEMRELNDLGMDYTKDTTLQLFSSSLQPKKNK